MPRSRSSTEESRHSLHGGDASGSNDLLKESKADEGRIREFLLPVRTVSSSNLREHWAKRYLRNKEQKRSVAWTLRKEKPPLIPCRLIFTRISPRKVDVDNLGPSLKTVIDAVCDWITPGLASGRSDSLKGLEIHLAQEKGEVNQYAVKLHVEQL